MAGARPLLPQFVANGDIRRLDGIEAPVGHALWIGVRGTAGLDLSTAAERMGAAVERLESRERGDRHPTVAQRHRAVDVASMQALPEAVAGRIRAMLHMDTARPMGWSGDHTFRQWRRASRGRWRWPSVPSAQGPRPKIQTLLEIRHTAPTNNRQRKRRACGKGMHGSPVEKGRIAASLESYGYDTTRALAAWHAEVLLRLAAGGGVSGALGEATLLATAGMVFGELRSRR